MQLYFRLQLLINYAKNWREFKLLSIEVNPIFENVKSFLRNIFIIVAWKTKFYVVIDIKIIVWKNLVWQDVHSTLD